MRITILGAGFCGTAAAWHLARQGAEVTVYDPLGIGGGASGIAAGMLHPFSGAHAKLNWRGLEGMEATRQLLNAAEKSLKKPIATFSGMLRPAISEEQVKDFKLCSGQNSAYAMWKCAEECLEEIPGLVFCPGLYIPSAITVDCKRYLQGLWLDCFARGVKLEQAPINSLAEVQHFDRIIVAIGSAAKTLPELAHLPIRSIKGQVLEIAWPQNMPPLPYPLNSQAYLLMEGNGTTCIAGATFEKQYDSPLPNMALARQEIMPKLTAFIPNLGSAEIVGCRAGIRAATPNRLPLVAQISNKCWVFTGMRSKGLLYHALLAKELAEAIASNAQN